LTTQLQLINIIISKHRAVITNTKRSMLLMALLLQAYETDLLV
jgi:hypothetical protein